MSMQGSRAMGVASGGPGPRGLHRSVLGAPRLRFRKEAFLASAGLSSFLLLIYDFCNRLTSIRSDVGVFCFSWEQDIPFIPSMIIPYLSMNLFFVTAPFVCRDNGELVLLCRRIIVSILIASLFFVFFPLRLGFARPETYGIIGLITEWFREFDKPYNMFPSLHIILVVVLADTYARHSSGKLRFMELAWFAIVGISTLFTKQHHVIDVIGGVVVGGIVLALFSARRAGGGCLENPA